MSTTELLLRDLVFEHGSESDRVAQIMYDVAKQEMETNTGYMAYLAELKALDETDVTRYAIAQLYEIMGDEDNHADRAKRAADYAGGITPAKD